jgi:DNA-binding HxlR family transcriptional regulator
MKEIDQVCPRYHRAVELIGRRWTGAIMVLLLQGSTRFNELASSIPEMSDRMLSERLKELEVEGIVRRIVLPETPVRVEYQLTDKGHALQAAVSAISEWAEAWLPEPQAALGDQAERSEKNRDAKLEEETLA